MSKPYLIIISGAPATGKTTLGRRLAAELGVPYVGRDEIKEKLFDQLGWSDRDWSRKVGIASYDLLYYMLEPLLHGGSTLIVESNFNPKFDTARFIAYREKYGLGGCQIFLSVDPEVQLARFCQRVESGERHPGHGDVIDPDRVRETLAGMAVAALDIGLKTIEIDMTRPEELDFDALASTIRAHAAGDACSN
jgi:predicted kinase